MRPVSAAPTSRSRWACGTDLARARADAVLLREDLGAVPDAIALARRTRRVIVENLAWAIVYNAVAIPLAALGLVTPGGPRSACRRARWWSC